MFVINPIAKTIKGLEKKSFAELKFKERTDLQEWIESNPDCLGERLLIIQKEFSGFADTYERLDLLAIDKDGNLVIIENKLDDSGRDVTWQALKYAAYCSTLTKEQIEDIFQRYLFTKGIEKPASQLITEFFDEYATSGDVTLNKNKSQRIVLVAANFRKEVTSTVLWLMNSNIPIQCFKATPYEYNDQLFLTLDQIIPIKDAQDYMISMAIKAQEELIHEEETKSRHQILIAFWAKFLDAINGRSALFQNSNATKDSWLVAGGADITQVYFWVVVNTKNAAVVLNFQRATDENKFLFDALHQHKREIETAFGAQLKWERMDSYKGCKLMFAKGPLSYANEKEWPAIIEFLIENLNKLERAVNPYLSQIKIDMQQAFKETAEATESREN